MWCTDVTYIPLRRGFLYLVAVMDWASRKVLSWRLSNTLDASFCVEALHEALERYGPPEIFNSDQGSQFTSVDFTDLLTEAGIRISMDGKGRWMDNVFIERLWRSLKYECVYLSEFATGSLRNPLKWNTESGDLEHGIRRSETLVGAQRRLGQPVTSIGVATGHAYPTRGVFIESKQRGCVWSVWAALAPSKGVWKTRRDDDAVAASVSHAFSIPPGVPGMLDSSEVQVLCPGLVETKG